MVSNLNPELNESVEKGKNQNQNIKGKFLSEFSKTFLAGKDKTIFINDIMKSNSISDSKVIMRKLQLFQSTSDDADIKNFDTSKINIFDLRRLVGKDYLKLKNSRLLLRNLVLRDYTISSEEFDDNLFEEIEKLPIIEIEKLLDSEVKLDRFLTDKLGFPINKRANLFPFNFGSLTEEQKRDKLNNLQPANLRDEVEGILFDISRGRILYSDIKILFQTNLFDLEQKKLFIKTFIPMTTLGKLVELGIYTKEAADIKKETILNELFKDNFADISTIIESVSLHDIQVSTNDLDLTEDSIFSLSQDVGFKNLEDNFRELNEKIREEEISGGPQTFESLKKKIGEINKNGKISKLDDFGVDNFVEIVVKNEKGEISSSFLRVKEIDDDKKILRLVEVGTDKIINLSSDSDKEISYSGFLEIASRNNISLKFYKKQEIDDNIKSGAFKTSDLVIYSHSDLANDDAKKSYEQRYFESKKQELEELKLRESELSSIEKARLKNLNDEILSGVVDEDLLLDFLNLDSLISKLNEIDIDGKKLGLSKGLMLVAKDGGVHEISGVSDGEIEVLTQGQKVRFTYEEFYQTFKKLETKRVKKINNFSELLGNYNGNNKWSDVSFENNKFITKKSENKNKNDDLEIEYFVSSKSDDIIRVHSINGNNITVSFGERKKRGDLDKKDKNYKEKSGDEVLFIEGASKHTFSLNQFKSSVLDDSKNDFHPSWETGKSLKTEQDSTNNIKGSFWSRFFDRASFVDLLAGGKLFFSSIEETLKRGNDLKSARFALSMGGFLPEELRAELQIKVEREEGDSMDKALEGLGKVDSWIAVSRIEGWLLNKNTPEYKKEAGIMFMLSKYGHLTSKNALYKYRGKFLWYEALGGKKGDDFFNQIEAESLEGGFSFSEEYLVHMLLKKQCGNTPFKGHKRRSRLHKEYEGKWASGISEELEKGYKDANAKRKAVQMLKGGHDEATGGTTSNALGWYKKAIERGGSLEEMNEGYFCLLYSGAAYDIDQKTYLNARGLWQGGMPIIATRFFSTVPEMKLFNKTILRLSEIIGKQYSDKFPNIAKNAKEIFDMAENGKGTEKSRFDKSLDFWKKYGKPLSNSLYMKHVGDSEFSKTDKVVLLEKENDSILGEYFNKVREFTGEDAFKKDYMDDACGDAGVSGLDTKKMIIQYMSMNTGGGYRDDIMGPKMWNWISNDIKSTVSKRFSDDETENLLLKKKYLRLILRDVVGGILTNAGFRNEILSSYNNLSSDVGYDLTSWGLILGNYKDYSPSRILNGEADSLINGVIDNILNGNSGKVGAFESVFDSVKDAANSSLSRDEYK
ncbi:MAG: hypothetical protein PHI37_02600 [Candidatus Gracilibacteria bacterium]|nr:hypothetical protein [Candidatus Gracilibacteria bacterium]